MADIDQNFNDFIDQAVKSLDQQFKNKAKRGLRASLSYAADTVVGWFEVEPSTIVEQYKDKREKLIGLKIKIE